MTATVVHTQPKKVNPIQLFDKSYKLRKRVLVFHEPGSVLETEQNTGPSDNAVLVLSSTDRFFVCTKDCPELECHHRFGRRSILKGFDRLEIAKRIKRRTR